MESMLIWGLALVAAALALTVLEVFLPSAGLIAVIAGVLGLVGVICLFRFDTWWGVGGALSLVILAPIIFAFGLKIMPSTPLGRKLLFGESGEDPVAPADDERSAAVIGAIGTSVTDLRPVGSIMIDGQRLSASSEDAIIPAGTRVRVVAVDGPNIRVRPVA